MRLVGRVFLSFFLVIFLALFAAAVIGSFLLSDAVRSEATSRVRMGLKEARDFLADRQDDLHLAAIIESEGLSDRVPPPEEPDILVTFDGPVPPVLEAEGIGNSAPEAGFILLDRDTVCSFNPDLEETACDSVCWQGMILCMYATRRTDDRLVFAASVINDDTDLVTRLQDMLFENRSYRGKPFGTVTIFCGDTRAATTVIGPEGNVARGTTVSEEVRQKVLIEGQRWLDRAYVVDEWYISAYEPILDTSGEPMGILYVGVLEAYYKGLRNRAVTILSSLLLPAMGVVLAAAWLITRGITGPIRKLVTAADGIASGRYEVNIHIGKAPTEIGSLAESFETMAQKLSDRERALRERSRELEDKNRDYQELLSFVTHELNNSIGSMLLNARALTEEFVGSITSGQAEAAEQILRDVERFRDMVRNYLNLSRMEKGTLPFNPAAVDLRTRVLEPALKRLRSWVEHREFTLEWDWPGEVMVKADTELMDIVFSNLLVNALKYGKEFIRLSARREDDNWIVSVANGGTPIPEERIPELFRKFSRLVESDDGVGLGLYLVNSIVSRHSGDVWCESLREGTVFSLRLPVAAK